MREMGDAREGGRKGEGNSGEEGGVGKGKRRGLISNRYR